VDARDVISDVMFKVVNVAHRGLLMVSGGKVGGRLSSMPVLQLHTTGRVSGQERTVMLTAPVSETGRWVLVASKGGDDRHPDWYRNLLANPEAEITVDGRRIPVTTRTAAAEEKAELWPEIVSAYKGYAQYQRKTERDIPVVICEARRSAGE
jgi:deazaflavin-dependent oxidoreductase (nitroreductase family)